MRTLVYFASADYLPKYQDLPYDLVVLVDHDFSKIRKRFQDGNVLRKGKVLLLRMDALEAIDYMKRHGIRIDCFVCINEGLWEGGGAYPINSAFFIGYAMPILNDGFIHIMSQTYYGRTNKRWTDIPFIKKDLPPDDPEYLNPSIFTTDKSLSDSATVSRMTKITPIPVEIPLQIGLKLIVIRDSIWNWYDQLDQLAISIKDYVNRHFFARVPKVMINSGCIETLMAECEANGYKTIGFTPWANGDYREFYRLVSKRNCPYPERIYLFHMNAGDYGILTDERSRKLFCIDNVRGVFPSV